MFSKRKAPESLPLELQAPALDGASAITFNDASNVYSDEHKHFGSNEIVNCREKGPTSEPASHSIQAKWNYPRINIWKTFVTFLSFFIMGANDGAIGVCEPSSYFCPEYLLTKTIGNSALCRSSSQLTAMLLLTSISSNRIIT